MKKLLFILLIVSKAHAQIVVPWTGGNDGPMIQNALNNASYVSLVTGKVYQTAVFLTVPSGVTFELNDSWLTPHASLPLQNKPLISNATAFVTYQASASIAITAGSNQFSYAGASNLAVGDLIFISGPVYASYGTSTTYSCGLYDVITAISGTTVTVSHPSPRSYTGGSIKRYAAVSGVHIRNGHLDLRGRTTGQGVQLLNVTNSSLEYLSVQCDSNSASGIDQGVIATGVNMLLDHITAKNIKPKTPGGAAGVAYAININGTHIKVLSPIAHNAQTCITIGGDRTKFTTGVDVNDVDVDCMQGTGHALDAHGNGYHSKFNGGLVIGGPNGAGPISIRADFDTVRNLDVRIRNNGIDMRAIYGFECLVNGLLVENCSFTFSGTSGNSYVFQNSRNQLAPLQNFKFRNNYVKGGMLILGGSLGSANEITGNRFETWSNYPASLNITATAMTSYLVAGNTFVNRFGNVSNYSINTSTAAAAYGIFKNDTVYIMDVANTFPQLRIYQTTDSVYNNVIYSPNNAFIKDFTGTSSNYYANNIRISGIGSPAPFVTDTSGTSDPFEPPPVEEPVVLEDGGNKIHWRIKQ